MSERTVGLTIWKANTTTGPGDVRVAFNLYMTAVTATVAQLRRDGVYVCFANIQARMPEYNQAILNDVLWSLSLTEGL